MTQGKQPLPEGKIPEDIAYWIRVEAASQWQRKGMYSAEQRNAFVEGCEALYLHLISQPGTNPEFWINKKKDEEMDFLQSRLSAAEKEIESLKQERDEYRKALKSIVRNKLVAFDEEYPHQVALDALNKYPQ